jgi:hypothetical protein
VPKVVVGSIVLVLAYIILYVLASFNQESVIPLPSAVVHLLFVYGLIGCLGMVVILPLLFLRKK